MKVRLQQDKEYPFIFRHRYGSLIVYGTDADAARGRAQQLARSMPVVYEEEVQREIGRALRICSRAQAGLSRQTPPAIDLPSRSEAIRRIVRQVSALRFA